MKRIISWILIVLCPGVIATNLYAQPSAETVRIGVDGVCDMCKTRIEKAALATRGVRMADWSSVTHELAVAVDPAQFAVDDLHRRVAAVGHDTDAMTATDAAYEKLHDCCKYRDPAIRAAHEPQKATAFIEGLVRQAGEDDTPEPLTGVNVFWLGTTEGTTTDAEGRFRIERPAGAQQLVLSYVGFGADTVEVGDDAYLEMQLDETLTLQTIEVKHRKKSTEYRFFDPVKVQVVSEKELLKAACCNLSESFETNPSVDVSFTDAVTGARQIEMLGLAGPYVQITRENIPDIRGLSAIYGLTYMPGPWLEGLQLIKGLGSVVNGYEAIAGQINLELWKPERADRLYANLYGNEGGRFEGNLVLNHALSEHWHTGLLLHGKTQQARMDRNDDGFLDNVLGEEFFVLNRWKYAGADGLNAQFGVRGTFLDNLSGQVGFDPDGDSNGSRIWGAQMRTRRLEAWAKIGKVFPEKPHASIGLQLSGFVHDQDAAFGSRTYDAEQQMAYANLIYQSRIGSKAHEFKTGLSFQYDGFDERLDTLQFLRDEVVPGAFFEYTFAPNEQFTAVAGLRADHHNLFGLFFTPRLHLRYALNELTVLRASAGRGQRTASIMAEHTGVLASARALISEGQTAGYPYGLDPEVAWNFGLNLTQGFQLFGKAAVFSADAYHTRFEQQVIVDYDYSPQELRFYNLDGHSYSNSLQVQLDMEAADRLDLRLAYRFNDVRTDYREGLREKPFVARHRAFFNAAYATNNGWKFDATLNWQGPKRIPDTDTNPPAYQRPARSPGFFLVNTQVSKTWGERFEAYAGVENLFNFRQEAPILASEDPFGPYFDASLVWGPIFGRMAYAGLRYRL